MIIGVCGLIGSGKGTVGDLLVEQHNFQKISFADKLKDGVAAMFDWDRELLEGATKESREWREVPDIFWSKELGRDITPRLVLQEIGTDCIRNHFADGMWALTTKKRILDNPDQNFVIPDVRFPNEIKLIQELNGQVWQVRRGEQPEWWNNAIQANTDMPFGPHPMKDYPDVHASEYSWVTPDDNFTHIIENNDTLEALYIKVETILST